MRLATVYVRFFRAFNYDFLRKAKANPKPSPWDGFDDGTFYPYIEIPIDSKITCIVGANESGKSQLLQAIEHALGQKSLSAADLCRYSELLTVSSDPRVPDIGLHFVDLSDEESAKFQDLVGRQVRELKSVRLFRVHPSSTHIYFDDDEEPLVFSGDAEALNNLLPQVVRIEASRPLPDSVPLDSLGSDSEHSEPRIRLRRRNEQALIDEFLPLAPKIVENNSTESSSEDVDAAFAEMQSQINSGRLDEADYAKQVKLARDLLIRIANIKPVSFDLLHKAFRTRDQEGLAFAIESDMNEKLRDSLNLSSWWSQDSQFRLSINADERNVQLTISDRTSRQYTFDERSDGLKYFLSYLVQALTHLESRERPEILLMDEPDTYLSNQGQQDLLRVLNEFTEEREGRPSAQVIYVTHSPYLIDRNRGDRIRVLDKGKRDEGARVVRDVDRNHFEPLRTALGGLVGETAFIGNCNLIIEGMADQIYLAGMSEVLGRSQGTPSTDYLDLNHVTLVPSGGASEVPYRVFLTRGRGGAQPAVIVLLDGDDAGKEAVRKLTKVRPYTKAGVGAEFITQITPDNLEAIEGDWDVSPKEIEDLIPIELGVIAARSHLDTMQVNYRHEALATEPVKARLQNSAGVFEAISAAVKEATEDFDLQKVPFARQVVEECHGSADSVVGVARARFAVLFRRLTAMQRAAERERDKEAVSERIHRETSQFIKERLSTCKKVDVSLLLERIESIIDKEHEGEILVRAMVDVRNRFKLDQNPDEAIKDEDRPDLKIALERLEHQPLLSSQPEFGQEAGALAGVAGPDMV